MGAEHTRGEVSVEKVSRGAVAGVGESGGRSVPRSRSVVLGLCSSPRKIHSWTMPDQMLMTMDEAATYFGGLKVFLRRWTGSGQLTCVRAESRRDLRFRQADIGLSVAFAERIVPAEPERIGLLTESARIRLAYSSRSELVRRAESLV